MAIRYASNPAPAVVKNAEPVKNSVKSDVKNTSTARTRKWRDAHPEAAKRYIRDYMRRWRNVSPSS